MNCPFCGTANSDQGTFCAQCGKRLKRNKPVLIASSSESGSSFTEQTAPVADDTKRTNSSDGDKHIVIVPQKRDDTDDQGDETAPSIPAVSPPVSTQGEVSTKVEVQEKSEDLSSITDEPTRIAPNPDIEAELPHTGISTLPESILHEEQTSFETQENASEVFGVASENHSTAITLSGDIQQSDDPNISIITPPDSPQQEPPMYSGGYGNYPVAPSSPNYPSAYGGTSSSPHYPGYPAPDGMYQSAPGYPAYTGYPQGQPDKSGTQYPPINGYPPLPGSFANQTGGPTMTGYPYPPTMTQLPAEREKVARIARPLPRWLLILCIVAVVVILGSLQAIGSDWADGAIHAAFGAIIIAVLLLVFAGIRTFLGMSNAANAKRRTQYIRSALAIMLLFVYSGLDLIGQTPLHSLQAHYVEGQQHWQQAINEYELGGETSPSSINLARIYDEWGEALNQSGHYTDALSKFDVALNNYTTPNEITRAQKGEINSYFSLGKQAAQNNNYVSATKEFDTALGLSFCHEDCQKQVNPSDATAYYNLAQSQLNAQQYNDAVNNFKTVQSRFVNYPEAKEIHGYLATALLGKGKQDKTNACVSAIPTYQDLAQNYADTPEGKDAANALSQPQPIIGHFTSPLPTDAVPMAVLTNTPIDGNMSNDQLTTTINNSPSVIINNNGTFKFQPQKQGNYDLAWINITGNGSIYYTFYYAQNDPAKPAFYVAKVGPLCPFDFGDIPEPIKHP